MVAGNESNGTSSSKATAQEVAYLHRHSAVHIPILHRFASMYAYIRK